MLKLAEKMGDNRIFVHLQGGPAIDRQMNLDHNLVGGLLPLRNLKGQIVKDVQAVT